MTAGETEPQVYPGRAEAKALLTSPGAWGNGTHHTQVGVREGGRHGRSSCRAVHVRPASGVGTGVTAAPAAPQPVLPRGPGQATCGAPGQVRRPPGSRAPCRPSGP